MPTPHNYYSYLLIYNGGSGEKPHSAAFYIPKYGDTLTGISKASYGFLTSTLGGVQRINRSQWNRSAAKQGAFKYRRNSTSCKSKIVDPDIALTTQGYSDGAWLALCPPYPLIWIPETDGQMPEDLAPPSEPPGPPGMTLVLPPKTRGDRAKTVRKPAPKKTREAPGPGPTSPYYQGQGTQPQRVELASMGGGIPWWIWLLLAAGAVGGYAWHRSRKKKRKKR
jgi:hypothetical protein